MKVLVCGGRDFDDYDLMCLHLREIRTDYGITGIIHGGARGADTLAGRFARENDIECYVYPANWNLYGKSAGYKRNVQMLYEGKPDLVVAFAGGRGTAMMIEIATKHNPDCVIDLRDA